MDNNIEHKEWSISDMRWPGALRRGEGHDYWDYVLSHPELFRPRVFIKAEKGHQTICDGCTDDELQLCTSLFRHSNVLSVCILDRPVTPGYNGCLVAWVDSPKHKQHYSVEMLINRWQIRDDIESTILDSIERAERDGPAQRWNGKSWVRTRST